LLGNKLDEHAIDKLLLVSELLPAVVFIFEKINELPRPLLLDGRLDVLSRGQVHVLDLGLVLLIALKHVDHNAYKAVCTR
jgi:hypothetical protein